MQKSYIRVGDAVVLSDGRRGRVVMATRSEALLLVRLNSAPLKEGEKPNYILCRRCEARRIQAWWNRQARRSPNQPDSRRAA